MEVRIAIFHKGLLSTYLIRKADPETVFAFLVENKGKARPPEFIRLSKQGDGWESVYPDQELVRELAAVLDVIPVD